MEFFNFIGTKFARLTDRDGKPWWVHKPHSGIAAGWDSALGRHIKHVYS